MDGGQPVPVSIDFILYSIENTFQNEVEEAISLNLWYHVEWHDPSLKWNSSDYDNILQIEMAPTTIWTPDLYLKGVRDEKDIPKKEATLCDVYSHGVVHCEFNRLYTTHCDYVINSFPFDKQNCTLEFGSFKYGSLEVDITTNSSVGNIKFFKSNNEWHLKSFNNTRIVKHYTNKDFIEIHYFLVINRKPTYYVMTMMVPSFLICTLAIVGLFSPFSSLGYRQEKTSLGLTTLLTMSVLLLVVSDQMPKTSSGIPPLLGLYILFEFLLGTLATSIAAFIIHVQQRALRGKSPPKWLYQVLLIERENVVSDDAISMSMGKTSHSYGCSSVSGKSLLSNSEIETLTNKGPVRISMMEMVKMLKCCYGNLSEISDIIENKFNEKYVLEKWQTVCKRLDTFCMIVLLVFNTLFSLVLLLIFGLHH